MQAIWLARSPHTEKITVNKGLHHETRTFCFRFRFRFYFRLRFRFQGAPLLAAGIGVSCGND